MNNTNDKVLFENKWVRVLERDNWYTYTQDTASNSGVSLLVINEDNQVLIRQEHCPIHDDLFDSKKLVETSVTGTVEKDETPLECAVKELREETGYVRSPEEFLELGWVYPTKQSNFKQYHFAIWVKGDPDKPIKGDGTRGEKGARTKWVDVSYASSLHDPSIPSMIAKLMSFFPDYV